MFSPSSQGGHSKAVSITMSAIAFSTAASANSISSFLSPSRRPRALSCQKTPLRNYFCPNAVKASPSPAKTSTETSEGSPHSPPSRLFSNIRTTSSGSIERRKASELGSAALVAGTMIGAGVLALPSVAAPAGFIPSSAALLGVWIYMVGTGLLISEVTIRTACRLGRPSGVSVLSLGEMTLGRGGALITAGTYLLLHYAILTAYTAQGGAMLGELMSDLEQGMGLPAKSIWPLALAAGFALTIGGGMYSLSTRTVEKVNNVLVAGVVISFLTVVSQTVGHIDVSQLVDAMNWGELGHGEIISVLFVSCVFHNVVSSVSMRLEGDRRKIRRVLVGGTAIPVGMFVLYTGAILGSGGVGENSGVGVALFSLLAVATSFVGFVEGLTELWTDLRVTRLGEEEEKVRRSEWINYAATLIPPIVFTTVGKDVFLKALDVAGTYGIAMLFGAVPAAMAWKSREGEREKWRMVGGGEWVLGMMVVLPMMLIGNKVWESVQGMG